MARVLSGTAPQITAQGQVDTSAATAWIQAHYDDFRGQWVAVRLDQPSLVASASTLRPFPVRGGKEERVVMRVRL